jgi:hypothetical protein
MRGKKLRITAYSYPIRPGLTLASACFARAVAVHDAALAQVVRRNFHVDAVAGKNLDAMPSQTSGNVRQDSVAIVKLDREGRAGKYLLDAAVNLKWRLFEVDAACLDFPCLCCASASSDR